MIQTLLVQYKHGFLWRGATSGGRESLLSVGQADDLPAIRALADKILAANARYERDSWVIGVEPRAVADRPYDGYDVGDRVTTDDGYGGTIVLQVSGFSVSEDDEGNPIYVPEMNSLLDVEEARVQRLVQRMIENGGLEGLTKASAPAGDTNSRIVAGKLEDIPIPSFSRPGLVALGTSGTWLPDRNIRITAWGVTGNPDPTDDNPLGATGPSTFRFLKNGVPFDLDHITLGTTAKANIQIAYGQDKAFARTEALSIECIEAGGHSDVVIQFQATTAV